MNKLPYIIIFSFIVFYVGHILYIRADEKFTVEKWASADPVSHYRMALYLEREKILIGKHKTEVLNMLGPASQSDKNYLFYVIDQPSGDKDGFSINLSMGFVESAYVHD